MTELKEADIQKDILNYLRLNGFMAWRNNTTGVYSAKLGHYIKSGSGTLKGVSDIIALKNGAILFLEIKTKTGKLSDNQKQFLKDVKKHGAIGLVARSISDVEKVLMDNVLI